MPFLQVIQPKQPEYKTFFQCLCCKNNITSVLIPEFDSQEELLSHLAVHHFKNFLVKEITDSIRQYPYCPHQNCDYLANNMPNIEEHFNLSHKSDILDKDNIESTLLKKCSKCFLGPFDSQDDLLQHIGLQHGEVVHTWVKKLTLTKTLEPLRKVIFDYNRICSSCP